MRPRPNPVLRIAATALTLAGTVPARAETAPEPPAPIPFAQCLSEMAVLARVRGVPAEVAEAALAGLAPDPAVLPATKTQAEFVRPIWDYLDSAVTPERIATGGAKLAEWSEVLARIEAAYGVDRHVLVAFWGVESSYGSVLENPAVVRPVVPALATLACRDADRAALWRDELVAALTILGRGDADRERMTGSWAGAMGHTQFMPSAYLRHAVDFDGDGRRDIWRSVPDALASTASYLRNSGWRPGEGWGREVLLPEPFDHQLADETTERTYPEWQALGLKAAGPGGFPDGTERRATLVLPAGAKGPAFLLEPNFRVILRYNTALAYALAVAHLADRLAGGPALARSWPRGDRMLTTEERTDLQARLSALGYSVGGVDGKVGPRTRAAIRAFQAAAGLVPDGYAEAGLLERVRAAVPAAP